jgi:16S rRNA (cytosine1407-C5)-methyltransferase
LENGTEKDLWELELFENGKIYIQQIASQIPVQFMDLKENTKILDTTAAPGSKTSQIAAITKNTSEIIAVDNNAIRIDKLNYTLKKQGVKRSLVFKTDARKIHKPLGEYLELQGWSVDDTAQYFDNILFDAPCTAEGRFNLNKEKSFGFWSETIFKKAYRLSKSILEEIIPMLKVGGILVYSTCTLAPEENEAITHFILSNYPDMELIPVNIDSQYARPGIKSFGKQIFRSDVTNTLRLLPSEENEGFYIAKFKKVSL